MSKAWPIATVQSLPDQVAHTILQRIAAGDLRPGYALPSQRELAQSMGVGLSVIREAVQRLAALNVVETTQGSGTLVRPFRWLPLLYDKASFHLAMQSIGLRDLWEARRLLERQIVQLAVERRTSADLKKIRAVLDRATPLPETYEASQSLNREFHHAVAEAGQNAVLVDLLDPLLDVHAEGAAHRFGTELCSKTWAVHEAIYAAIAKRDAIGVKRAIEKHFTIGPIALEEIEARGRAKMPRRALTSRRREQAG